LLDRLRRRLEVLSNHPVARRQPVAVLSRFATAELVNTWIGHPFVAAHDFGVELIVQKGHHATRSHYFFGLQDFVDELFAIHFLRKEELFIDIGANLGIFSIVVAAATGARVIAVEPSPSSSRIFKRHLALNALADRVTLVEAGAGAVNDTAFIRNTVDMDNFIVPSGGNVEAGMVKLPIIRIDDIVDGATPCLMKMDVEGFEMQALKGATRLLGQDNLLAITVEISDLSRRFGGSPEETHAFVAGFGFTAARYDPLTRALTPLTPQDRAGPVTLYNYKTIYVRNLDEARKRLAAAPYRRLGAFEV
jgi:FkbM family methyltransferase